MEVIDRLSQVYHDLRKSRMRTRRGEKREGAGRKDVLRCKVSKSRMVTIDSKQDVEKLPLWACGNHETGLVTGVGCSQGPTACNVQ